MRKPIRRSSLAISPRLGKIMINLSGIKEGKVLDAFCGVGTILQEALLQGFEVVGVDTDAKAIKGAEENLKWFGFEREKYSLINFDSTRVTIPECSVMVSEPDLGTTLKKTPPRPVAEKTLKDFERLIIRTINNVKGKVSGRFVFSSPLIRIGKKRIGCNIEEICARTDHKLALDAIDEYREAQFVGRRIFVLEKA
jgi:tRNA G10  N-methylase Trm11